MRNLSTRWISRFLSMEQNCMATLKVSLVMFKFNLKEFLKRYVIVAKTWIDHYSPEMKKKTVKAVDFLWWTCFKDGENGCFGRKYHGYPFFGIRLNFGITIHFVELALDLLE